jgi:prepilin-type N-terminal cleavage/methylation domain-containing protein
MIAARLRLAFTLIELLVVISIIVVLLALLTPALDQAIYHAEMLQCMTNHRMLAGSSQLYAMDNKRWYPDRDVPINPTVHWGIQAHKLTHVYDTQSGAANFDLRPMLRPYVSINKVFNDVFVEPVDYDKDQATGGSKETTHLYTSIFYWAGWQYTGPMGGQGLKKLGGHFAFTVRENGTDREFRFTLLVGDIDCREGAAYSSHPDDKYLIPFLYQDFPFPFGGLITSSGWTRPANTDTLTPAAPHRDPLDLNYAYEDGSVLGVRKVVYIPGRPDPRMALIPNFNFIDPGRGNGGGRNQVPAQ